MIVNFHVTSSRIAPTSKGKNERTSFKPKRADKRVMVVR